MSASERHRVVTGLVNVSMAAAMVAFDRPRHRSRPWFKARRAAIYMAVCGFSLSRRSVARAIGVTHYCCNQACWAIEDERERPDMDARLTRMASAMGVEL